MKDVLTLILGGGAGTRLYPLTKIRAKPAVPLAGKYRLVDVAISNCINSELKKIYVLTQYLSASLNRHIAQTYTFDQFSQGFVETLAAEQRAEDSSWFQGTADAVRKHWLTIDNYDCETILILPGDALYRMDYRAMVRQHRETGADITVAVNTVDQRHAHHFGLLALDNDMRISEFREKPKTREDQRGLEAPPEVLAKFGVDNPGSDTFLASMGVYLFKRSVLHDFMANTNDIDFGKQIIPNSIKDREVYGFIFDGYWEDIGTIEAFYKAHMDLLEDTPPFQFAHLDQPVYTRARYLPSTKFTGAQLDKAVVADGCNIGKSRISHTVVGLRQTIGDHTTIEESILMGADYYNPAPLAPWESATACPIGIGDYCHIRKAIIDKNARISNEVKLLNTDNLETADGEFYYIREGIIIIPKNTSIPAGVKI